VKVNHKRSTYTRLILQPRDGNRMVGSDKLEGTAKQKHEDNRKHKGNGLERDKNTGTPSLPVVRSDTPKW
jgi:hypothetical protein